MPTTLAPVEIGEQRRLDLAYPADEPWLYQLPERLAAGVLLVAAAPLIMVSAGAVMVLSGRSPFVAHRRVGYRGRELWLWKIRTMWPREGQPTKDELGLVQRIDREPAVDVKPRQDDRVTSGFAAFCRRHSIDELPQIAQVAMGGMSLIGPRPVTYGEFMRHYAPYAAEMLSRRPGLTGLWQTSGRSSLSYAERVELDLQLVREGGWRRAWQILWRTVPAVITGKNAW